MLASDKERGGTPARLGVKKSEDKMAEIRIGSCSLCGGDVVGWVGAWFSTNPPPPAKCSNCGAGRAADVIHMTPKHREQP